MKSSEDKVQISIKDYGIGMSEEIKLNLFEASKLKSRSGTNNEGGSGYGLSIAKHFVENFQGALQVNSVEQSVEQSEFSKEHGTTFIITMPKVK